MVHLESWVSGSALGFKAFGSVLKPRRTRIKEFMPGDLIAEEAHVTCLNVRLRGNNTNYSIGRVYDRCPSVLKL